MQVRSGQRFRISRSKSGDHLRKMEREIHSSGSEDGESVELLARAHRKMAPPPPRTHRIDREWVLV